MIPRFRISGTAGRIVLKFGAWIETNYLSVLHKTRVGCICACARANLFSVSRKQSDELALKFWWPIMDQRA